jgi:hypothetical protein
VFVPHRKQLWASGACYGNVFSCLYVDDVHTHRKHTCGPLWPVAGISYLILLQLNIPICPFHALDEDLYMLNLAAMCFIWTAPVVSWSEFVAADPEVPDSIPDAARFSE